MHIQFICMRCIYNKDHILWQLHKSTTKYGMYNNGVLKVAHVSIWGTLLDGLSSTEAEHDQTDDPAWLQGMQSLSDTD